MSKSTPTETLIVPSRGLLYDGKLPEGELAFKPMTAKEEKILSGGFKDGNSMIDAVLKSCLPENPIPLDDMLIADKYFAMLTIRAFSYGSEYGLEVKCPSCSLKFRHSVNLGFHTDEDDEFESENTFYIKVLDDGVKEPFETILPRSSDVVQFRLLRGKDEKAISRYADQQLSGKRKDEGNPTYTYRLARHIVSVNGDELSLLEARDYVENLIGEDSVALRDAIENEDCGVDGSFKVDCPRCEDTIESYMTLGPEFFRPRR